MAAVERKRVKYKENDPWTEKLANISRGRGETKEYGRIEKRGPQVGKTIKLAQF